MRFRFARHRSSGRSWSFNVGLVGWCRRRQCLADRQVRRLAVGLGPTLCSGHAIAATHQVVSGAEILLGAVVVCWVGLPLLLVGALLWQVARAHLASFRRPLPTSPVPDTDLMA